MMQAPLARALCLLVAALSLHQLPQSHGYPIYGPAGDYSRPYTTAAGGNQFVYDSADAPATIALVRNRLPPQLVAFVRVVVLISVRLRRKRASKSMAPEPVRSDPAAPSHSTTNVSFLPSCPLPNRPLPRVAAFPLFYCADLRSFCAAGQPYCGCNVPVSFASANLSFFMFTCRVC